MGKICDRPEYKSKAPVLKFWPNQFVSVAVKAMSEKNYGAVVIVDPAEHPIGIVTERDLMRRLLAKGLDPATTPLSEIMTRDLKLARDEDNVLDWVRQMSNERFRHVPVVNSDGRLISLMSQGDFVSYTWPDLIDRVRDQTSRSLNYQFQLPIMALGIAVYTFILIFIFRTT
jgi:signal-transduction protein with cAMP-binding, CBS, and nucleotidyltransferase domain